MRQNENSATNDMMLQLPGEKLLVRLWETLAEKGVGYYVNPYRVEHGLTQIEVSRAVKAALARVEKEFEALRTGQRRLEDFHARISPARSGGKSLVPATPLEPLLDVIALVDSAAQNAAIDAARNELNVAKAVLHAEAALRDDEQEPPPTKLNEDWLLRWNTYAGNVSSEELQMLWGRVLSEEIKYPGLFSLRTLDFIRNLSRLEAHDIAKLSRFVVSGVIWSEPQDLLSAEGVDFGFLLRMQDLGLISGVGGGLQMVWKSVLPQKFAHALSSNGKALVLTHPDPNKTALIPEYSLTSTGLQVLQLGQFEPHIPYLKRLGLALARQGFSVSLGDHKRTSRSEIQVFNLTQLSDFSGGFGDTAPGF